MTVRFPRFFSSFFVIIFFVFWSHAVYAFPPQLVPSGNRNIEQPPIPSASKQRTSETNSNFTYKYLRVRNLLYRDLELRKKIKEAASLFDIHPIHIVGALVGEHTYNVDAYDHLQNYYTKALAYFRDALSFEYNDIHVLDFVEQDDYAPFCKYATDNYELWTCREEVWEIFYRNQTVKGIEWPDRRFGEVFFQPFFVGQTFGLGQLHPLTALKVNDIVRLHIPSEPILRPVREERIYRTIMDPDSSLFYVAAVIRLSIDSYRDIANFDISENPGITATLYNLGNVTTRASALAEKNLERWERGLEPELPQENYYGWLVNIKLEELLLSVR